MWTVHRLEFRTHIYWVNKEKFQYEADTYAVWSAFIVESGAFTFQILDAQGEASIGDIVLCPPNTPFHRKVVNVLTFHFCQFDWKTEEETGEEGFSSMPYGLIRLKDTARLSSTLAYLKRFSREPDVPSSAMYKKHFLTDLFLMMVSERKMEAIDESNEEAAKDPVMQEARLWLERRYAEPISLQQLADYLSVSRVQLTRRFKKIHGVPPIDFLTDLRLKKAGELLLETNLTLDRIAKECGYENGFYLSRVFSKHYGTSPSQYRAAYKV